MQIVIQNKEISATINTKGAELTKLKKDNKNYIWTINKEFWNKTSPVLFPVVGKLKNDSYTVNNKNYTLSRHGFARNLEFEIIHKLEETVTFSLKENQETLVQFPFCFELQISYTLIKSELIISYLVINNSDCKMPFSIGAHPAFAINSNLENYALQFYNDKKLLAYELENEQFSGKTKEICIENKVLPLNYAAFENDALVLKKINSKNITVLENSKPYLNINLGNFPNLGIWTKKNAPFLCIEPWFGLADNANSNGNLYEKEGIQIIEINQKFETQFSIELI